MQGLARLSHGFGFLRRGYRLSGEVPGLKKWVAIPFVIDLILLFLGFSWGWSSLNGWVSAAILSVFAKNSLWYSIAYYPLYLLFFFGFLVVLFYGLFLLATVVASPFNAIIAEKTLIHLGVMPPRSASMVEWLMMNLKMFGTSIVRALLFAILGVFILILSFFPFLNILGSYFSFLVVAFDSSDYALEVMQVPLKNRLTLFKRNLPEYSGMAGMLGLTLLIPGLTVLILPLSVVGASEVVSHFEGIREKNKG